jgi:glycosyltransferase involved in cell wall biosynthesis
MTPTLLQILPSFNMGGVERVTFETITGLAPTFGIHHIASSGGRYIHQLPSSVMHHTLPLNTKNPFMIMANTKRLYKLIKDHKIDLIHARSRAPAWSTLIAARMAKIPFITTYHGTYNARTIGKHTYNSVMVRGDYVIAISKFIETHIQTHYPHNAKNVTFIPEGIDTSIHDPKAVTDERIAKMRMLLGLSPAISNRPYLILLPGRLTRWKGQTVLLNALRTLNIPNWHAIILGDAQGRDTYKNELTQLAQGLPVTFITNADDMPAMYALADVVLSCSTDPEAFGRVTAEALAMQRPVIGTTHGGTIELTANGLYGTLVPPNDYLALSSAIMNHYNTSPEEQAQRGMHARQHIQDHYSLTEMIRLTKEIYEKALRSGKNIS